MVKRARFQTIHGEAEAVARHRAHEGTFDPVNRQRHDRPGAQARAPYQSRQVAVGKRDLATRGAWAVALGACFAAAAWARTTALVILLAAPMLWLLPFDLRWWPNGEDEAQSRRRVAGDLALAMTTWAAATWALWNHRLLPLAVCTLAGLLVLLDSAGRRLAFPRRAGIL